MAKFLSTGCKNIDDLMDGGLVLGCPHALYGKFKNGKSIFALQIACMCTRDEAHGGLGRPALIYDTELFWSPTVFNTWYKYFRVRFPDLPVKPNIKIIQLTSIYELANELGFTINIHRKESKTEPVVSFPRKKSPADKPTKETEQRSDWLEQSPVWKSFTKNDWGVVIIDSFTMLFKDVFESAQQNFPGRSSAQRVFLSNIRALAARKNCVTLIVCHETARTPWGGESIPYYIKHIIGIFEGNKTERGLYGDTSEAEKTGKPYEVWKRVRIILRNRHPYLTDGAETAVMLEKDRGFCDTTVQPCNTSTATGIVIPDDSPVIIEIPQETT